MLWGGIYGGVWAVVIFFFGLFFSTPEMSVQSIFAAAFALLLLTSLFCCVGMMAAGVTGIFSIALASLFNRTMNYVWSPLTATKISGGLAAFLCTCSVPVSLVIEDKSIDTVIAYVLGPIVAMFFGHIGAARTCVVQIRKHYQRQQTKVKKLWVPDPIHDLTKFNIRQMMVLTAWFGVIFAIFTALGRYSSATAIVLASYFIIQFPVYFLANLFVNKYIRIALDPVTLPQD